MTRVRQIREAIVLSAVVGLLCASMSGLGKGGQKELKPQFHTSDRCLACHNGLTTASGKDVSIGFAWRARPPDRAVVFLLALVAPGVILRRRLR